jgi:predicted transcriptional regulator
MQGGGMTPEELKKLKEEVEDTLYGLIKMGAVETHDIDEDGNFTYRLTEKGKELGEELIRLGLGDVKYNV